MPDIVPGGHMSHCSSAVENDPAGQKPQVFPKDCVPQGHGAHDVAPAPETELGGQGVQLPGPEEKVPGWQRVQVIPSRVSDPGPQSVQRHCPTPEIKPGAQLSQMSPRSENVPAGQLTHCSSGPAAVPQGQLKQRNAPVPLETAPGAHLSHCPGPSENVPLAQGTQAV